MRSQETLGSGWIASRVVLSVVLALMVAVGGTRSGNAQVSGATLSGVVTDSSGALVTNAVVAIRNAETGVTRTVTTNSDGFYSAPDLLPGNYEVKTTGKGFSTMVQKGIVLTVAAQQTFNPVLSVGRWTRRLWLRWRLLPWSRLLRR